LSLRGASATKQSQYHKEIATLPVVARNDRKVQKVLNFKLWFFVFRYFTILYLYLLLITHY